MSHHSHSRKSARVMIAISRPKGACEPHVIHEIPTGRLVALCAGDSARGFLYGIITTYLMTFFIPTTSASTLPIFLVNAGATMAVIRFIGTIVDAVIDPFIANFSDRLHTGSGRRIPLMRLSALPYAAFCLLIFFPPVGRPSVLNGVWVGAMLILYYVFNSLYNVPFMALQAEIVSTPRRRVFLYTISSLMFVIASALIYLTSTFKGLLMNAGFSEVASLRIPFAIFSVLGMICAVIPVLVIRERDWVHPKASHVPLLASLKATFSYRNYVTMTLGYLAMWMAFSFFNATLVYYIENLLSLPSAWVTVVAGISVVAAVATYPLLNILARTIGKRPLLVGACCAYIVIYTAIYLVAPWLEGTPSRIMAVLIGVCIAFPISITNIIPSSIFADLAQVDTIVTGERRSGMFMAARNFVEKLAEAGILLVIPPVLLLGSTDGGASTQGIRLTALIAAVAIAVALMFYLRYDEKDVTRILSGVVGEGRQQ